ncbi:hypothetical protein L8S25_17115 [Enterobacter cloacae]|uniref:hypothetical protein n=1 Tax=Enterobacter cloacae TaxID=550 RepID=UPI002006AB2F|nr:hypothetical protein [Enterobacter cloacae]MCK6847602.1 hypothetical protein [Enterobacter cloacae]
MVIEARLFDKPVRQAKSLNGDYHAVRLTTLSIGRSMLSDGKALSEKSLKIGWRSWLWFLAAQGVLCSVAIVLILTLIPSLDEIHDRRLTLMQLQKETEGFPLYWGNCTVNGKVTRCFRTDDKAGNFTSKDGSTWHVPWQKP